MSAKSTIQWAAIGAVLALNVACDGVHPDRRDVRYFAPFQTTVPKPQQLEDRGPQLTDSERNVYEPIIDGFQKNHDALLRRDDITEQLERIENVYVEAGRYLDLYAIYQADYARFGMESPSVERLAWGSIRLGQQKAARTLIDELINKRGNATSYFLDGAYWLQWDPTSPDSLAKTVKAWKKTLALDPDYRGFENITAAMISEQLARMEESLAQNPPAKEAESPVESARAVADAASTKAEAATKPAEPIVEPTMVEPEVVREKTVEPLSVKSPASPKQDAETQYRIAVARGDMLVADGKLKAAEDAYLIAKSIKPNGFEAEFGQLRAGWNSEGARAEVSRRVRILSERKDLTARQAYDIGLFALSQMQDKPLAKAMFTKVKTLDPVLATQLDVDGVLKRMGP